MKSLLFSILFLSVLCCSSCKNQEKPVSKAILFEDYFIRYLSPEQQLKAQAVFAEGDTITNTQPKSFVGGISFQGSGMAERKISNELIRYEETRKMDYADSFSFRYKNEDGNPATHIINMSPIEDFFLKSSVSKTNGLDIVVKGGILSKQESLVFLFSDKQNIATSIELKGPTNTIEFHLPPAQFSKLNTGKGKLYIVKKQSTLDKVDNRDIHAEIEYYTKDIEIEIMDL